MAEVVLVEHGRLETLIVLLMSKDSEASIYLFLPEFRWSIILFCFGGVGGVSEYCKTS